MKFIIYIILVNIQRLRNIIISIKTMLNYKEQPNLDPPVTKSQMLQLF